MTPHVRFYADSADTDSIAPLLAGSLIHGVTTNPTILARSQQTVEDIDNLYGQWKAAGAKEIFFQTWGSESDQLLRNARRIAALGKDVVVKVPATAIGYPVAAGLAREGVTVLLTAVYSTAQALAAASIGVRYIAPYLGRIQDANRDGLELIGHMHNLLAGSDTDVLAASLRSPEAIVQLADRGIQLFTAAPSVLWMALQNDDADRSALEFEAALSSS
jgi:transaldolase